LLGGITVSRAQDDFQSGLGTRSRTESTKQTELVVTIRPRLLLFGEVAELEQPAAKIKRRIEPKAPSVLEPVATVGGPLRLSKSLGFVPSPVQMISKLTPFQE
jgi:hypothetical protein